VAIVLPVLLEKGIMSTVGEIRGLAIETLMKVVKNAGKEQLRPHMAALVTCMLESLSVSQQLMRPLRSPSKRDLHCTVFVRARTLVLRSSSHMVPKRARERAKPRSKRLPRQHCSRVKGPCLTRTVIPQAEQSVEGLGWGLVAARGCLSKGERMRMTG